MDAFIAAGADHITIHVESEGDLVQILEHIRECGCSAGITLRPGTPAATLQPYLNLVDMVKHFGIFAKFVNNISLKNVKILREEGNLYEDYLNLKIEGE